MEMAAYTGEPLSDAQLGTVLPARGAPASIGSHSSERTDLTVIALSASGRPVGLLALSADAAARHEREPLLLFANHIALAVERAAGGARFCFTLPVAAEIAEEPRLAASSHH
jgi:hypothetical protein